MAATFIFGKRKTRLGVESGFEECRTRLGSASVVFVVRRMVVSVISCHVMVARRSRAPGWHRIKRLRVGADLRDTIIFVVVFLARVSPCVASMLYD